MADRKSVRDIAKDWARGGLSVIPIRPDGTKAPSVRSWKIYQSEIIDESSIDSLFAESSGIAIVSGKVSGDLEVLDFDVPDQRSGRLNGHCFFEDWRSQLPPDVQGAVAGMPTVRTPSGGIHLYYRCEGVEGNQKLAAISLHEGGHKTIVETRGEGGYVLSPACSSACHPSGKTYDLLSGDLSTVPRVSVEQRDVMFKMARSFDEAGVSQRRKKEDRPERPRAAEDQDRPGDDYNRRGRWEDLLEPLGWSLAFVRRDGAKMWLRPGKKRGDGISATVREFEGVELFHAFTSNSAPFPTDESITKFKAYALIHHGGNFESAARDLSQRGFGQSYFEKHLEQLEGQREENVPWSDSDPTLQTGESRVIETYQALPECPEGLRFSQVSEAPMEASMLNEKVDPLEDFSDSEKIRKKNASDMAEDASDLREKREQSSRGPGVLVWLDAGRPPKKKTIKKSGKRLIKTKTQKPRGTAWLILKDHYSTPEDSVRTIHYQNGEYILWREGKYVRVREENVRSQIARHLTHFAAYEGKDKDTGKPLYKEFEVRKHAVSEILQTLQDWCVVGEEHLDPCWIARPLDGNVPDPREVVCCQNGILDIENDRLLPLSPALYSFTNTQIHYDPEAQAPTWQAFLESTLEDEDSRLLLQEWFGYCLVQDTRKQKMMMVVGKPGSGKGTAITVLQWLIGSGSYCSMDFERIGDQFALQVALGKSVMIFPDARQSFGNTKGSVIGTLLSISGEDEIFIDRKKVPPITKKLNARIVIVSNDVINLTDSSGALSRRMLWLRFPGFKGSEDTNLKAKLNEELSGILNWAIEGYHRVRDSGVFTRPSSADYLMESFQEQSSPIKSFLEDMCEVGPLKTQPTAEIFKHWTIWRKIKGYKGSQSESAFGKQLISADMSISKSRSQNMGKRVKIYKGVELNPNKVQDFIIENVGQREWDRAREELSLSNEPAIIDIFEYSSRRPSNGH